MDVEIALLLDQQSDLYSHRAALHFFAKAKAFYDLVHARASMGATRGQTHRRQIGFIGNVCSFGFKLRALDPCSFTSYSAIKNSGQRLINNSEHALTFFSQADLNCEIAVTVDEAVGAVERVDHPHARLFKSAFGVDRFFGEDAVVWKHALEAGDDHLVRDSVGLSYRLDVVVVVLLFDTNRTFVQIENGGAGRARELNSCLKFLIVHLVIARKILLILTIL